MYRFYLASSTFLTLTQTSIQILLQNIAITAPIVSFLSLRVLDRREPSVESCQPLYRLGIACVTEINQPIAGTGIPTDEHTFVVDTIDNFIPYSLIASNILCPQY